MVGLWFAGIKKCFFFIDGFARRGNRLTMVFIGCNKVIVMPNSFILCIEYKLDFLAEA